MWCHLTNRHELEGIRKSAYLHQENLLLAFNAQKFRGSRDPGHAPFSKNFKGHVRTPWENARQQVGIFNRFGAISI